MKYLEARALAGKKQVDSVLKPEAKMMPGARPDQKNPESLVSSPSRALGGRPSKAVKKLADELSVDLASVQGTGPQGEITEKDVRLAKRRAMQEMEIKSGESRSAGDESGSQD